MQPTYAFDSYEFDPGKAELRRDGVRIHLEPQTADLLLLLLQHRQRIVSRDEIFAALWKERVVSEDALSSRVRDLRRALNDDGRAQRYVQTIKGRGFRFVGSVNEAAKISGQAPPQTQITSVDVPTVLVDTFIATPADNEVEELSRQFEEELIAAMTAWRVFPVIAQAASPEQREAASYKISGTMRRSGQRLFLRANLVAGQSQHTIWSDRLVGDGTEPEELVEILALRLAWLIVLQVRHTEAQQAIRRPVDEMSPWELSICASWLLHRLDPGDITEALTLALRARDLVPGWLLPQLTIANCLFLTAFHGLAHGVESARFDEAYAAARQAHDLDETSWFANSLLGLGELWSKGNYQRAKLHVQRAIELNPGGGLAFHIAGCVAGFSGDLETAIGYHERHMEIDPVFRHRNVLETDMALWKLLLGEYEDARKLLDSAIIWNANFGRAHHRRIALCGLTGDTDGADMARAQLAALNQMAPVSKIMPTYPFQRDEQREIFEKGLLAGGLQP